MVEFAQMSPTVGSTADGTRRTRPPWWMLVLAVGFTSYYGLLLYSDITRPEPPGFVLGIDPAGLVVHAVAPSSRAADAGMRVGDRVARADGHPVSNHLDWLAVEMNVRVARPLRLAVSRDRSVHEITLVLNRVPWTYWLTAAGATLLIGRLVQLVTLALAIVIVFRRPFDPAARVGAWALGSVAAYSIVWPYQLAAHWRDLPAVVGFVLWIPFISGVSIAAVLFTFFAIFPRRTLRPRWLALALIPMVPVLSLQVAFAARAVYRPERAFGFIEWAPVGGVVTIGYTVAAIGILVTSYRRLTDLTERRRVRMLVLGSSMGLLSALSVAIGYWSQPDPLLGYSIFASPTTALLSTLGLAFPISFAYAILRHRLFDLALVVRLGVRYALARRVLTSIVPAAAVIFAADLWLHRQSPVAAVVQSRGWGYIGLAGLAAVAGFRRQEWLDRLDRRFFRERFNAQRVLREIGDGVRSAPSLDAVAPRIVAEVESALHPELVALFLCPPHAPAFEAIAVAPPSRRVEPLPSGSKVAGLVRVLRKPLQVPATDRSPLFRQLPPEEVNALQNARIELLVPVHVGNGASEVLLALGPKRSEEPYSAEDEDLLIAVAHNVAFLLSRAAVSGPSRETFEECIACGACHDFGAAKCPRDGTPLVVVPMTRMLGGRYRLDRRIGRGGMGTVYAALDATLNRHVAAKVLREEFAGPEAAERFQSEARLAATLAHPNVVTVHDFGVTASGRAFFIMELLDGVTLREELARGGRLPPARASSILRGVCAAVEAAHNRQLIHRDLKPENIFLCRTTGASDMVKILDFGIAKALEARGGAVLTAPGMIAGTPQYMAPEHLSDGEPSPDWDLWALAVVAFEMLTGRLPAADGSPAQNAAELPDGVRELFSHALSANPLNRPTSAREFCDALNRELLCDELSS
jgi:hypothetical protein